MKHASAVPQQTQNRQVLLKNERVMCTVNRNSSLRRKYSIINTKDYLTVLFDTATFSFFPYNILHAINFKKSSTVKIQEQQKHTS